MQRTSVGLFNHPIKYLNANDGIKVSGNRIVVSAGEFQLNAAPVLVAAAAA